MTGILLSTFFSVSNLVFIMSGPELERSLLDPSVEPPESGCRGPSSA